MKEELYRKGLKMFIDGQSIALDEFSYDTIQNMNSNAISKRMDQILNTQERECYPFASEIGPFKKPRISDLSETKLFNTFTEERKKETLYYGFEFLVQMIVCERVSGFSNHLIYNSQYDENLSWKSPLNQIRSATIEQSTIVLSRVAFEKFMNLVYFLDEGLPLDPGKKKSKLTFFFNHLKNQKSKFIYFLPKIPAVRAFDNEFRTGEVHKKSGVIRDLIRMSRPTHEESNASLNLTNLNLSLWMPLIEIMGGTLPHYYSGEGFDFLLALKKGGEDLTFAIAEVEKRLNV